MGRADHRILWAAAIAAVALARASHAGDAPPTPTNLLPYVVPASYFEAGGRDLSKPLGHGLHIALIFDLGGRAQSATAEDLRELDMSVDRAHQVAIENLATLAAAGDVKMAAMRGPDSQPFVLVGGHWAAATSILLPHLGSSVVALLETSDICASIPHREAMLIFGCGDRAHRDAMRALIREKESGGAKPLTFELFRLTATGVEPLAE